MNFALNNNKQQWLRNFSSEKLQTYHRNTKNIEPTSQIETDNHITAKFRRIWVRKHKIRKSIVRVCILITYYREAYGRGL